MKLLLFVLIKIKLISYIESIKTDIWNNEKAESNLTDEQIRENYNFIMEEKTHHNNGYNSLLK